jgi:MoxR-like ATPase
VTSADWRIYRGGGDPHTGIERLPAPPPWRTFHDPTGEDGSRPGVGQRARSYLPDPEAVEMVNAALFLRRPLLVTGKPGTGKSTLAYSVAHELQLGPVLYWPITSRSGLQDAIYRYDAIGRLREANLERTLGTELASGSIGRYVRLGPLGTALLPSDRPRVLLIDELDKSDVDLPNDLLNVFEEGQFEIDELVRLPEDQSTVDVATADPGVQATVVGGSVRCREFPLVIITSNGERAFPPAFLRRCLPLNILPPSESKLEQIVVAQLGEDALATGRDLVERFVESRDRGDLATDQLLNAIYLTAAGRPGPRSRDQLVERLFRPLNDRVGPG